MGNIKQTKPSVHANDCSKQHKSTIPRTKSAKEYMEFVEEHSQFDAASKSLTRTLMSTLTIIKFDGSCTMLQHIIEMININKKN